MNQNIQSSIAPLSRRNSLVRQNSVRSEAEERRYRARQTFRRVINAVYNERKKVMDENADLAVLCILDAFQGRLSNGLENNKKKSAWIYNIFCIQTSSTLFQLVLFVCVIHSFFVFFDWDSQCSILPFMKLFHVCVNLIYAFDIALKIGYEGIEVYIFF
jgi:hypothetical protein